MTAPNYIEMLDINYFLANSSLANDSGMPFSNRFVCRMGKPVFLPEFASDIDLQVYDVDVPEISYDISEMELNGIRRSYFKERSDGDLQITFIETPKLSLRDYFNAWMLLAVNISETSGVVRHYTDEYIASSLTSQNKYYIPEDIIIFPLANDGNGYTGDRFLGPYVTRINSLKYDYGKSGEFIKTTVTFKYLFHEIVSITN